MTNETKTFSNEELKTLYRKRVTKLRKSQSRASSVRERAERAYGVAQEEYYPPIIKRETAIEQRNLAHHKNCSRRADHLEAFVKRKFPDEIK